MKALVKEITLRCCAFSLALAPLPFLLRTDNLIYHYFEETSSTLWLILSSLVAALLAVLFICKVPQAISERVLSMGAGILTTLGIAIILTLQATDIHNMFLVAVAGCLTGFGLALLLFLLGVSLSKSSPWQCLLSICATFLGVSLVWFILNQFESAFLLCVCLGLSCLLGSLGIAVLLQLGPDAPIADIPEAFEQETSGSGVIKTAGFFWAGYFGIAFNFFTLGLTFWPHVAGLGSGSATLSKTVAYLLVGLGIIAAYWFLRNSSKRAPLFFYQTALPIGVAIVLFSPFLDTFRTPENSFLLSCVSFAGIALLNVLGFTAALWSKQHSGERFAGFFALLTAVCVGGFAAGLIVFSILGQQAQIVSLCLLSLFLVLMVFAAVRNGFKEQGKKSEGSEDWICSACQRITEEFSLSPREAEILTFLAKGRGPKHIGEKLFISSETVRTHAKRIYDKTGVHTKEELLDLIEHYQ